MKIKSGDVEEDGVEMDLTFFHPPIPSCVLVVFSSIQSVEDVRLHIDVQREAYSPFTSQYPRILSGFVFFSVWVDEVRHGIEVHWKAWLTFLHSTILQVFATGKRDINHHIHVWRGHFLPFSIASGIVGFSFYFLYGGDVDVRDQKAKSKNAALTFFAKNTQDFCWALYISCNSDEVRWYIRMRREARGAPEKM